MQNRPNDRDATTIIRNFFAKGNPTPVTQLQRSMKREEDHNRIFSHKPITVRNTPFFHKDPAGSDESSSIIPSTKIRNIAYELISESAIVSSTQFHWTSEDNLRDILNSGAIYSNRFLKKINKSFEVNGLNPEDVRNGDDAVICLTPFAVDLGLFFKNCEKTSAYRNKRVRLTLDLTKIDANFQRGQYNQFMKVYDFCSNFYKYECQINNDMTFSISRVRGTESLRLVFNLKGIKYTSPLTKKAESIFYGNLYANNRHCLLKIFELAAISEGEDIEGTPFIEAFIPYLESLSNDEAKKVLVSIGQTLTYCAEYNFIDELRLTPHLISDIYFVDTGINYSLKNLSEEEYQAALLSFSNGEIPPNVPANPFKFEISTTLYDFLYGPLPEFYNDLSHIDPTAFKSGYFETRLLAPSFINIVATDRLLDFSQRKQTLRQKKVALNIENNKKEQQKRTKSYDLVISYRNKLNSRGSEYKYPGLSFLSLFNIDIGFSRTEKQHGVSTLEALVDGKTKLRKLSKSELDVLQDGEMKAILEEIRTIFKS